MSLQNLLTQGCNEFYECVESPKEKQQRLDAIETLEDIELIGTITAIATACLALLFIAFAPGGLIGTMVFGILAVLANDVRMGASNTADYLENMGAQQFHNIIHGKGESEIIKDLVKDTFMLKHVCNVFFSK